jgi:putative Mg2+ transporter-C (MgtC) family protein
MSVDLLEVMLRMGAAIAAGAVIGYNRDLAGKSIGMRTLGLVSLGSAVVSLATMRLEIFAQHPDALSRVLQGIIQGVMGGIGFIGAGVILRDRRSHTVEGLTTAASVWLTAALGIACALAAWRIVLAAVCFALITLIGIGWAEGIFLNKGKRRRDKEHVKGPLENEEQPLQASIRGPVPQDRSAP